MNTQLDLVAIGRVSVDLYGQQSGSRLEDVSTFAKAVGGCPANVAIGVARLGLKSALISRVGDEPMGRFVLEQLTREGVETRGVALDRQRLTSLVLLSMRDEHTFPLIFYRENCADSALCEDDIEASLVASSRAVLVTGTHLSISGAARAPACGNRYREGARTQSSPRHRLSTESVGHRRTRSRRGALRALGKRYAVRLPTCCPIAI